MEHVIICKVCGKAIEEESMIKHIKTHDPTMYFEVVEKIKWR